MLSQDSSKRVRLCGPVDSEELICEAAAALRDFEVGLGQGGDLNAYRTAVVVKVERKGGTLKSHT